MPPFGCRENERRERQTERVANFSKAEKGKTVRIRSEVAPTCQSGDRERHRLAVYSASPCHFRNGEEEESNKQQR